MSFTRARFIAATAVVGLVITLTACGTPPWADPSLAPNTHTGSKAVPSSPATITPIVNDLASGSTKRVLTAGDITLTVTYWSDLAMTKWTTQASKPLSISAVATVGTDAGQAVYLSKLSITAAATTATGAALPSPATLSDPASVSPGYAVKSPYSYTQTFTLPALDKRARSLALTIEYELLLQTTPTSDAYAKQSVNDSLTIAIRP